MKSRVLTFLPDCRHKLWGFEDWLISAPGIPLLVKILEAKYSLSIQVHPNETTCRVSGGDAKTEMWFALSDGVVYAGLRPGTTAADLEAAVAEGSLADLLVRHDVKTGDILFVPGGLVHAVGAATKLYEVQQPSDTTFRLFDWGRVGEDGKPRELHVAKALAAIDYTLPPPQKVKAVECPYFSFRPVTLDGSVELDGKGYTALYAFRGSFTLGGIIYPEGSSVLVQPGAPFEISGSSSEVLVTETP